MVKDMVAVAAKAALSLDLMPVFAITPPADMRTASGMVSAQVTRLHRDNDAIFLVVAHAATAAAQTAGTV